MPSLHPNTFPEQRGLKAAERMIKQAISPTGGDGAKVTDNEVRNVFAAADQYMPNGEQVSLEASLKLALKLLQNDLTKEGIAAVFARFGIEPPKEDPVVGPGPGDIVVRPRYGLMETARPIIERTNAGASEEDVARLHILKALADRAVAGDATPRVRGRAAFNQPAGVRSEAAPAGTRSLGGRSPMEETQSVLADALARVTGGA